MKNEKQHNFHEAMRSVSTVVEGLNHDLSLLSKHKCSYLGELEQIFFKNQVYL